MADATTLVKYIAAHAGHSRRKVTDLIKEGKVTVNSQIITEPWHAVTAADDIRVEGKRIFESKKVYFLLNKPTGYITTMEDDFGRADVSLLMKGASRERIFPIGRLDQDTTGLLLFTNDGELAQTLSHPRFNMKKEYMVTLDKPVSPEHLKAMFKGVFLKDGKIRADRAVYVPSKRKFVVIIEIHSGKKHIIRRLFHHFGYEVRHLDRIEYAGLNKKGLKLGKWRALTPDEITNLQAMAQKASEKARKPKTAAKKTGTSKSFTKKSTAFGSKGRAKPQRKPVKPKQMRVGTPEWFAQDDQESSERSRAPRKKTFNIESWFNEEDDSMPIERAKPTRSRTDTDAPKRRGQHDRRKKSSHSSGARRGSSVPRKNSRIKKNK